MQYNKSKSSERIERPKRTNHNSNRSQNREKKVPKSPMMLDEVCRFIWVKRIWKVRIILLNLIQFRFFVHLDSNIFALIHSHSRVSRICVGLNSIVSWRAMQSTWKNWSRSRGMVFPAHSEAWSGKSSWYAIERKEWMCWIGWSSR